METIPDEPRASLREGVWFVFRDGDTRIAQRVSRQGLERLYVNGLPVGVERKLRWQSERDVEHGGVGYRVVLSAPGPTRGGLRCALLRDGEPVATLEAAPIRPPRLGLVGLLVGLGFGVGMGLGFAYEPLWGLACLAALFGYARLRARRADRWVIASPAEVRGAQRRARLHALRRWPAALRGLLHTRRNLAAGLRLASARSLRAGEFRARFAQVVALTALTAGLALLIEWMRVDPPREPWWWGWMRYATVLLAVLAASAAAAGLLRVRRRAHWLAVVLLTASVWYAAALWIADRFASAFGALRAESYARIALVAAAVWFAHVLGKALAAIRPRPTRGIALPLIAASTLLLGSWLILPEVPLWYTDGGEDYEDSAGYEDTSAELDVEGTYYRQAQLLEAAFDRLEPQWPGVEDVFFVGFAAYEPQDVFMKEVDYVRGVVERHFGATGRSISLVNNTATIDRLPLANPANLGLALRGLGERIDVEEDVLFLYLTSHGSRDGTISVEFEGIHPRPLSAERLRELLDESGIQWRIVVVSACYSGSFIDALRDDHTLVLTAASDSNTSFGCSDHRELTYFAEHLFQLQLDRGGLGLLEAFENARTSLEIRELDQGFTFSDPQIFLGEWMKAKLRSVERSR